MDREVKREPEVPELNNEAISLLSELIFREDDTSQKVDLIFVFGAFKEKDRLVEVMKELIPLNLSNEIFLTGGPVENTDKVESELILEGIGSDNYPNIKFWKETKSTNTLDNVKEALKIKDFSSYKKILFVFKTHGCGRGYLTLRKFLPDTELLQMSWSPSNYGEQNIEMTKNNWFKYDFLRKRVWGEFLRIKTYGERGDIYFDTDTKRVVDKIINITTKALLSRI